MKNVVFPNLMQMGQKILILEFRSLITCGESVRHSTTPICR